MRTNLARLISVLHAEEPPKEIWQQPFDYDPSHYERLCNLNGAAPSAIDLTDYAEDMLHAEPLQPDLFRYLLPICLDAWHKDLLTNGKPGLGNFVDQFWPALAKTKVLASLKPDEYDEVRAFMTDALLDRIDQEVDLSFFGSCASPYTWSYSLGAFCVALPELPPLWRTWWEMATPGHACAGLQYLSCLLYKNDRNPIFSPWTPVGGGGPPGLWEKKGHIYDRGWRRENVEFLRATLTMAFIDNRLHHAAQILKDAVQSVVPQQMLDDFPAQQPLLEKRLAELPSLLLSATFVEGWSV